MKTIAQKNINENMFPFWKSLKDEVFGGFYGYVGYDLIPVKNHPKGCILNSRILWFFSNAYLNDPQEETLSYAHHAYAFLKEHCYDDEFGGVYWEVDYDGMAFEDTKHTYNIAFAIYALSSYYRASKKEEALALAMTLFDTIENKCKDTIGYKESFTVDFQPVANDKLADNEKVQHVQITKTMNTVLHLLEAYTELYIAAPSSQVKVALEKILQLVADKIIDHSNKQLYVFFDDAYNSLADVHSYGHDIEAAWLIDRAAEAVQYRGLLEITQEITDCVLKHAYEKGRLYNERVGTEIDRTRVWWVQAETVVGLLNAYQKTNDPSYYQKAEETLQYIQDYFVDPRPHSEWFWSLNEKEEDILKKPIVEEWKCPYHNGRMFFEIIRRKK